MKWNLSLKTLLFVEKCALERMKTFPETYDVIVGILRSDMLSLSNDFFEAWQTADLSKTFLFEPATTLQEISPEDRC
jgi:hypothetical protein